MRELKEGDAARHARRRVPLRRLLPAIALLGVSSLGGWIAYYHDAFVHRRRWLSDEEYLEGATISSVIPDPIFVNFTVFAAERLGGWWAVPGSLALILVPGASLMLVFSALYVGGLAEAPGVSAGLKGIGAAAAAFTAVTLARLLRQSRLDRSGLIIAALAFLALGPLRLSIVAVVPPLALAALWLHRPRKPARD